MKKKLVTSLLLVAITLSLMIPQGKDKLATSPSDAWIQVWSDEFNQSDMSAPDENKWSYDIGTGTLYDIPDGWGNNELQYYTDRRENSYIQNGKLVIKALRENYGNKSYTSARLISKNKGDWTYGRFVIRAKLPNNRPAGVTDQTGLNGIWPAIWMLPTDKVYGTWPASGEIDIMEMVGKEIVNNNYSIFGTLHFGNPWSYTNSPYNLAVDGQFHDFSVEWDPGEIRWYVDNHLFQTRRSSEWYSSGSGGPNKPFDQNFHMLLNLAVGGTWPGSPDASTLFPQTMEVDYVRVYQRPATGIISGAEYKLINLNSNRALNVAGAGTADGSNVQLANDNGSFAQRWKVVANTDGTYKMINKNSGKVLDVAASGTSDGTSVQIRSDNDSVAQKWQFISNGDNTVRLMNPNSGKMLNPAFNGTADGTSVQIYRDNGNISQKWSLILVETQVISGKTYSLVNLNSEKALDVAGGGTANGTNVQIASVNNSGAQQWQAIANGDGTYRLLNPNSGKSLDVAGAGTSDGTNVQIADYNGSGAQKWTFVSNGDGTYRLLNPLSGKVLDVASGGITDGTNVQIWSNNGSGAQKWVLIEH